MDRIYIAGPMRNSDPLKFLDNIRRGIQVGAFLTSKGYAPFCPMLDYQYFLQIAFMQAPIELKQAMDVSIEWLKLCDAVLVLPEWEYSEGVKKEIHIAQIEGIPVFFNYQFMHKHFTGKEEL